jgi:hypothetical protein
MKGMFGIEGTCPVGGVTRGRMSRAFSAINGLGHEPRPLAWAGMNDAFGVSNAAREAVSTLPRRILSCAVRTRGGPFVVVCR